MGYRFKEHETVPDGIKRIALELIDKTIEQTKPQVKNRDKVIHDTRVTFKKLRALLRLTPVKHNAETFKHEDACFRDAGRCLSRVRDQAAMIEALDKLTERYPINSSRMPSRSCASRLSGQEKSNRPRKTKPSRMRSGSLSRHGRGWPTGQLRTMAFLVARRIEAHL